MKRKRGGQPGNQNARKHGFFSSALEPGQIQEFWDIIKKEHVSPEVALIRARLLSSLRRNLARPDLSRAKPKEQSRRIYPERSRRSNRLVLNEAAKIFAKLSAARLDLNRAESRELKKAILCFWDYCADPRSGPVVEKKNESSAL